MSTPSRNIRNRTSSGLPDPKLDTFADVKRAFHAYLMKHDDEYRKASENWYDRRKPKETTP